jgi:hypothetical protein
MAHLNGADEREARKAESKLWTSFVRDGRTDQLTALRYLNALGKRPDHTQLASRERSVKLVSVRGDRVIGHLRRTFPGATDRKYTTRAGLRLISLPAVETDSECSRSIPPGE